MKILFIINDMNLGGVETLTLRLAKECREHDFYFLSMFKQSSRNVLLAELKKISPQVIDSFNLNLLVLFKKNQKALKHAFQRHQLAEVDVIYSFNLHSFILSHFIKQLYFPQAKVIAGVYHPNEYVWPSASLSALQKLSIKILLKTDEKNIFFMNEANKSITEKRLNRLFPHAPILPLMVDDSAFDKLQRNPAKFKIVSIGRICDFKTYNFTLLEVMKKLHQEDQRFSYHIYGHGPLEAQLIQAIKEADLKSVVFFHGPVPYAEIPEILRDAFVFIGMGTTIIEACAAGVPSLQAVVSNKQPTTNGWFHDLTGFNVGETEEKSQAFALSFYALLIQASQLTQSEYDLYCLKACERATHFSADAIMPHFFEKLQEAETTTMQISWLDFFKTYLHTKWDRCKRIMGFITPFSNRYNLK